MLVLLDDWRSGARGAQLFAQPRMIVTAREPAEVATALARIEDGLAEGLHAAGYFAYELGYVLEPKLAPLLPLRRRLPLIAMGLYGAPQSLDATALTAFLARDGAEARIDRVWPAWSGEDYSLRFEDAHTHILSGDIYQINLTFEVGFRLTGSARGLYSQLRTRQSVAHGGLIEADDYNILSVSPEQFVALDGLHIVSRPMKGTAPRGATPEADAVLKADLAADPKQRAENLMIVDLMRNDIGRLSEIGSVRVSDLFTVETFPSVHQMTSGVEAQLRPGTRLRDLLAALFPPGSVTGAPKIAAMEQIARLETAPRGVYCGGIGTIAPDRSARFNVAIRTPVVFPGGEGVMNVGSGCVADSEALKEYAECLLKMRFLAPDWMDFQLIETLLFEPGAGYVLLERHMERLVASARQFGFECDLSVIRTRLATAVSDKRARVRLLLARDGAAKVTATPLDAPAAGSAMRYVLAEAPVDSGDPFLAHKTTHRQRYDADWARAHDSLGVDEVIYVNERGELAEGSRTNVFLDLRTGPLLTPPLAAGALPGVLRAELIATGRAVEATLTPADLTAATMVYLGNSVRGLAPAQMATNRRFSSVS